MNPKSLVLRARADADVDAAVAHYLVEAPHRVDALLTALQTTLARLSRSPGSGSARYAHELEMPGLRHVRTPRFPYLVFYVETPRTRRRSECNGFASIGRPGVAGYRRSEEHVPTRRGRTSSG